MLDEASALGAPHEPRARRAPAWIAAAALWAALASGCGGESVPTTPPECDDPPTFTRDIQPLVERACLRCHSETLTGGARAQAPEGMNFDRYDSMPDDAARATFVDAITSGRQPPPTLNPPLTTTAEERAAASAWRTCGYLR